MSAFGGNADMIQSCFDVCFERTCEWGCAEFGVRMLRAPSPASGSAAVSDEAIERMANILSHAVGFGPTSKWLGRRGVVIRGLRQNQDLRWRKLTGQSGTGVGNV